MMGLKIMDKSKKARVLRELEVFGLKKSRELFIRTSKDKIRVFSGSFSSEEIREIGRLAPIEIIGLYAVKDVIGRNNKREVRLSIDGVHFWKEQIAKRIVYLNEEQEKEWFLGQDFDLNEEQISFAKENGFYVFASKEGDLLGMGKVSGGRVVVYVPKERRVRYSFR